MRASGSTYENKAATLIRRTRSFYLLGLTLRQRSLTEISQFTVSYFCCSRSCVEMSSLNTVCTSASCAGLELELLRAFALLTDLESVRC